MGRLVRSRLKNGINMRRDSYFLVVSCTSLLLYAICLYTFLHLNGYIGAKSLASGAAPPTGIGGRHADQGDVQKSSLFAAPYVKSQAQFDDGKIHEFQHNVGHPVDWDMRVKELGIHDIGEYIRTQREKREHIQTLLQQPGSQTAATKRGPPRNAEQRRFVAGRHANDKALTNERESGGESSWRRISRSVNNSNISANQSTEAKKAGNHSDEVKPQPLFPTDLFTQEERQRGAVILHVMGVVYMFVALAVVCDEFFVPSLDVIIEKLNIPDDVAGATFMAAGGSAPELFTSVIGVFVSFDDVGIGTIVGSAVFNILFVIGMCALFSKTILSLTWWPLFRDCTFYSISLIALVLFFMDNLIVWWEAALLLGLYALYVSFMRWNEEVERIVKRFLYRNTMPRISSTDHLVTTNNANNRGPPSQASVSSGGGGSSGTAGNVPGGTANDRGRAASAGIRGSKFRHGLLTLMIHSIDPMHDGGHVDDKANKLHAIASLRVLLDATKEQTVANGRDANEEFSCTARSEMTPVESFIVSEATAASASVSAATAILTKTDAGVSAVVDCTSMSNRQDANGAVGGADGAAGGGDEEAAKPLDLSWPEGTRKQLTYIFLAPILWPLWLTLPDTRTPQGKRFFVITFIGSILWIAAYSYLMVWWANLTGETVYIPPEVMGLTFLAAGTSIPDLITSVIVARKGLGDMAVSSSVGSNIFDICVGLPLPWLLYCIIMGSPVPVSSSGMACSVLVLFGMLCFVVLSIACARWKMNKALGITMFVFYFVFVAVSLGFEYGTLSCPV
ncbi:sodium/potassium/calcium exchanger Nckx30C-like isoform X2 [Daphnia carinata]|uniref:sodium/potassium/calcium exchanger Nckx30C-like isoform X2 n=1 Tax=Daphnia carinata TaxID=120202 RepID=UPI002868846D|nr:sodium/potassium/calcium exchanger Nckx30C-like isoform X2 [Daphnia carinata]